MHHHHIILMNKNISFSFHLQCADLCDENQACASFEFEPSTSEGPGRRSAICRSIFMSFLTLQHLLMRRWTNISHWPVTKMYIYFLWYVYCDICIKHFVLGQFELGGNANWYKTSSFFTLLQVLSQSMLIIIAIITVPIRLWKSQPQMAWIHSIGGWCKYQWVTLKCNYSELWGSLNRVALGCLGERASKLWFLTGSPPSWSPTLYHLKLETSGWPKALSGFNILAVSWNGWWWK